MATQEYAVDTEGNEVYGKDQEGNEVIEHGRYARKVGGQEFYPKDKDGHEFRDVTKNHIKRDGKYILPLTAQGKPQYDIEDGTEIYPLYGEEHIIGVGSDGNEYYAKKSNGDEYYPPGEVSPAKNASGQFFYAQTSSGETVFPQTWGAEYYVDVDPLNPLTIPSRYIKLCEDEYYPKIVLSNDRTVEYLLSDYAKLKTGQRIYPKDRFNNEYYLPEKRADGTNRPAQEILPTGMNYAVTNDSRIILPDVSGSYYISPTVEPSIEDSDVFAKLIRDDDSTTGGYLTTKSIPLDNPELDRKNYSYIQLSDNSRIAYVPQESRYPRRG